MNLKNDVVKNYEDLAMRLYPLGFKQVKGIPGFFYHEIIRKTFDFSSNSPAGAMKAVYVEAFNVGAEAVKKDLRKLIGMS